MIKKIIASMTALVICLTATSLPVFANENSTILPRGAYIPVNKQYNGDGYILYLVGSYERANGVAMNIDVKAHGVATSGAVVIQSCNAYQNGDGIRVVVSYYVGSISDSYTHTFYA